MSHNGVVVLGKKLAILGTLAAGFLFVRSAPAQPAVTTCLTDCYAECNTEFTDCREEGGTATGCAQLRTWCRNQCPAFCAGGPSPF